MKNDRLARLICVSSAALVLAACADQGKSPIAPDAAANPSDEVSGRRGPILNSPIRSFGTRATPRELASGELVAKTLALALRNPALGEEIKQALASSAVKEHKLHLSSFLEGRGGNILRAGFGPAGVTEAQFQAAMSELRQMEFYMPVEEHRRKWDGGSDVLVALYVSKGDQLVAYRTDGSRVELSLTSAPSTPMLAITHLESDFRDQIKMNKHGLAAFACQSQSGETLESSEVRCESTVNRTPNSGLAPVLSQNGDLRAPAGNFIPAPRYNLASDPSNVGLYANFIRLMDASEFQVEGQPEVEIHVTGRRNGPGTAPIDYQCSGEHAGDANGQQPGIRDFSYAFNMDDNFWSGDVRILNASQVDSLLAADPAGFNVSMWEDDSDGPCNMHESNAGEFADLVAATAAIARGVNAVTVDSLGNHQVQWEVIGSSISQLAALVHNGDDYLGMMVVKDSITQYANQFPGNTHVIMHGTDFNGRATLYMKRIERSASIQGVAVQQQGQTSTWTASAGPAVGSVYYAWEVDGEPVQDGASNQLTFGNSGISFLITVIARDDQGTIAGSARNVFVMPDCVTDPTQPACPPGGGNISVPTSSPVGAAPSTSGKQKPGIGSRNK